MVLIFKSNGRTNYSIEAFILLAQQKFLLSPRERAQLQYSRFIDTHGMPGRSISCDLHMEHLNQLLQDAIKALGANDSECNQSTGKMHSTSRRCTRQVRYSTQH